MFKNPKGTASKILAAKEKERKEKRELLPKAQTEGKAFLSNSTLDSDSDSDSDYFVWLEIDLRSASSESSEEKRANRCYDDVESIQTVLTC